MIPAGVAGAIRTTLKAIASHPEYCPEYYPNAKPEMERFLRTAEESFFSRCSGYRPNDARNGLLGKVDHLFTLPQARQEFEAWIIDTYHERPHAGISTELERSPRAHWEATVHLNEANPRDLDPLILQRDRVRVVGNRGIRIKLKHTGPMVFWHPELAHHWRERVQIGCNPDDWASILVYYADTGGFICEAYRMGVGNARYTSGDVAAARNRLKRGLVDRLDAYAELVQDVGRPPPPPPEPAPEHLPAEEPAADEEVLALMRRMEARDRGTR